MVPGNTVKLGSFSYTSKKNISAKDVVVSYRLGTNIIDVKVGEITSVNDPAVIDRTAAGQVALVEAVSRAILDAAGVAAPVP